MSDAGLPERLNSRFEAMERRLAALERRMAVLEQAAGAAEDAAEGGVGATGSPLLPAVPAWHAGGTFPVLGKALLGIAGAYLLRAIAEAHIVPEAVMELAAVAYALLWLAAGGRGRSRFAAVTYACTSVLILAPMLWELTMSFHTMRAAADAGALAAFAAVALMLARKVERAPVLRIANLSAAGLALALAVATHDNLPFLAVLLLMAAACEHASVRGGVPSARPVVALAADLGVWMLLFIYRAPAAARTDYPAVGAWELMAPGFVLFAIAAAGVTFRNVMGGERIAAFDAVQATMAFLLAGCGLLYFGPAEKQAILGGMCLVLAAALYAATLGPRRHWDRRDRMILSTWTAALILAGIWYAVPGNAVTMCLAGSAIAATAASGWSRRVSLAWQATAFLLAAGWFSGLLIYVMHALATTAAGAPGADVWITMIGAAACYALLSLRPETLREDQAFPFLFAVMAAVAAASLLVQGAARLATITFAAGPHHLALMRSSILCAAAVALAFSGARWRRVELTQIGYCVLVLEAIKLLVEDLRHGHLAYVAASVCLLALTLIAIPRVARHSQHRESLETKAAS